MILGKPTNMLMANSDNGHLQGADDGDDDEIDYKLLMITFKVLSSMLIIAIFSEFPVLLFATIFNWFVT